MLGIFFIFCEFFLKQEEEEVPSMCASVNECLNSFFSHYQVSHFCSKVTFTSLSQLITSFDAILLLLWFES